MSASATPRYACSRTTNALLRLELVQDWRGTSNEARCPTRSVTLALRPAHATRSLRTLVRNIAFVAEGAASDPRRKAHVQKHRTTHLGEGSCEAYATRDGVALMLRDRNPGNLWIRHQDLPSALRALAEGSELLSMQELLDCIAKGRAEARAANGADRLEEIASQLEGVRAGLPEGRARRGTRAGIVARIAPLAQTPHLRSHLKRTGREELLAFVKRYAA